MNQLSDAPGVSLWQQMDRAQAAGVGVALTPEQVRALLAENARLVEAKNEAVRASYRPRFLCERCGGTGRQEAGMWDGNAYAAPAGVCDDCGGEGLLGPIPHGDQS